jgi:ATP-dependent Lhr-like helicase
VNDLADAKFLSRRLHPRLSKWFRETFSNFTDAQLRCVPAVLDRQSILLTSPTGSGKTLAGFLGIFDFPLHKIDKKEPLEGVQCVYVSSSTKGKGVDLAIHPA